MRFQTLPIKRLICAIGVAGCGGDHSDLAGPAGASPSPPRSIKKTTEPATEVTAYAIKGVVRKVEPELEHVTIQHEAIPGFMDAMRMRFAYKDKSFLSRLLAGDHVEGTLRVERSNGVVNQYELQGLRVTSSAPAALAPNLSRKTALPSTHPRRLEIGDSVPDFTMTTQDGRAVRLSDLRGNVVVLTFIYTRCPLPDFCPLMDRKFSALAERIGASPRKAAKTRLISLSFDPDHDSPELLKKHAQVRGATPPLWSYAVASHLELAKIGMPLGLFYQPGDTEIAHNLCTAVIDPDGKLARLEVGTKANEWTTADLMKTISALVSASQK